MPFYGMSIQIVIYHWSESECHALWPSGRQTINVCSHQRLAVCFVFGKQINGHPNAGQFQRVPFNRQLGHRVPIIYCLSQPTSQFSTVFASSMNNCTKVKIKTDIFFCIYFHNFLFHFFYSGCSTKAIISNCRFQNCAKWSACHWRSA